MPTEARLVGRIPVRNLWLLQLYASDLARFFGRFDADVENAPDLASLVARLLAYAVERRLRRNLSRGYVTEQADLARVRGRINIVRTYSRDLLRRGEVACHFEEHTINTTRNRLVRAALDAVSGRVAIENAELAHRCRSLAGDLGRLGVDGVRPSRAEIIADHIGRHDAEDLLMVTLSRIAFDLVLPTEETGAHALTHLERDEVLVRHLFEKAVGNFYAVELDGVSGWRVFPGRWLKWQIDAATPDINTVLPNMKTDIILENAGTHRRIVIDTKFTSIFAKTEHRDAVLKSGYLYQMYAYLRSQEGAGDLTADKAEGILLHPTVDADVDEWVTIQGHRIRFVTVNLAQPSAEILAHLRKLPHDAPGGQSTPSPVRLTVLEKAFGAPERR
jgi:5-methylcytosine-specific restriction enzyme subunit McrC